MRIFGDKPDTEFKHFIREPGFFYGHNDVLKAEPVTVQGYNISFWGTSKFTRTYDQKLYLHIPRGIGSTMTGMLRKFLLPGRWKTAYLEHEDFSKLLKVLVCVNVSGGLSARLSKILGRSLFVASLIKENCYDRILGHEYIRIRNAADPWTEKKFTNLLGELHVEWSADRICSLYRSRGLFSALGYCFRKKLTSSWEEVCIQAGNVSQKVLIKKIDKEIIEKNLHLKSL